jgi:hypothetical protein
MRAKEFLLTESMMTYPNWSKVNKKGEYYYLEPFMDGIIGGQIYSFNVDGNKFNGIIQNPVAVNRGVRNAIKRNTWKLIIFDVEVVDDEGAPTGEVVNNVHLNQIYKDEKIKGVLKPNMGNVSEALLGCAVAAKFMSGNKPITEKDLVDVGRQIARNKGMIQAKAGKDTLLFKISIPFLDKKAFYTWLNEDSRGKTLQDYNVPEESIALIERRAKVAVEYANSSKRVISAVEEAKNDPNRNKVDVISDGGQKENQSVTKVDLKILIDGKETAKRLLSVKAGNVAQFGQVTGVNFEHANEFFTSSVGIPVPENLKKYFYEVSKGARNAEEEKAYNYENGYYRTHQFMFKELTRRAKTDQAGLVEDVYQGLLHHLTRKEPGVEMVILDPDDKKAFRELSFGPEFASALRQMSIVVAQSDRANSYNISIYGFPSSQLAKKFIPGRRSSENKLVDLTTQLKDGSIRNMLSMGSLLKNIADIENYIEQHQEQPSTQPVANTPVPGANPTLVDPVQQSVVPPAKPKPAQQQLGKPMGAPPGQQDESPPSSRMR